MSVIRNMASFARWRLVPLRYVAVPFNLRAQDVLSGVPMRSATAQEVHQEGHAPGPTFDSQLVDDIRSLYLPRAQAIAQPPAGHPFVNLFQASDIHIDNPACRLAFSRELLDVATDYFGGDIILDSIQVLYSWPTEGPLRESQKWHKDYGDSKSFHCITYVNDVMTPEDGPFVFVDKQDTRKIRKLPIVRRISDEQFRAEVGDGGQVRSFYGTAGTSVFVDPSVCYHYGSRCKKPRLAVFVTFNTRRPFMTPIPVVAHNASQFVEVAAAIRPDLSRAFLRSLLRAN